MGVVAMVLPTLILLGSAVTWGVLNYGQILKQKNSAKPAQKSAQTATDQSDEKPEGTKANDIFRWDWTSISRFVYRTLGRGSWIRGILVSSALTGLALVTLMLCGFGLWVTSQIGMAGLVGSLICIVVWLIGVGVGVMGMIFRGEGQEVYG